MPKYNVILSYCGAYNVIVDAPNEDSAIDYAKAEVDAIGNYNCYEHRASSRMLRMDTTTLRFL